MTPAEQIDAERRERERDLLLLLLLLMEDAIEDVASVIVRQPSIVGIAIITALQLRLAEAEEIIANGMAEAHADAFVQVGRISGERTKRTDAGAIAELVELHRPQARAAVEAMADTIGKAVAAALAEDTMIDRMNTDAVTALVEQAFDKAGYSADHPRGLEIGAERAVVSASNIGMIIAGLASERVTGLKHVSILDDATTDICEDRHNLMLPIDDPYWWFNIPALHPRCRSVILPIVGEFTQSDTYPTVPPMAGFGQMPRGFIEAIQAGKAA